MEDMRKNGGKQEQEAKVCPAGRYWANVDEVACMECPHIYCDKNPRKKSS